MAVLEAMKPISARRGMFSQVLKSSATNEQPDSKRSITAEWVTLSVLVSHGLRAIFSTAANEEGFEPDVISHTRHVDTNEVRRAYNQKQLHGKT